MSGHIQRIAIFIKSLQGGGAERSTVNLANALADSGLIVDLLVIDNDGVFSDLVSPFVNVIKLPKASMCQTIWCLRRQPKDLAFLLRLLLIPSSPKPARAIPAMARYLRLSRPDALLTALDYGNVAAVVARTASGVNIRIVLGQRNQLSQEYQGRSEWRKRQIIPTLRYFFAKADAIVSVSKGVSEDLGETLQIARHRLHAIYNAVFNKTLEEQSFETLDHPWFLNADIPVILAVGKLKPQKDYVTLLKAFAKVRMRREVRLVILEPVPK